MAADTWGLSWKGTTGSWLASWARNFVPPTPPEIPTVTPAGRKTRKRSFVEIDGQTFEVADAEHARALFDRAREMAVRHAQKLAEARLQTARGTGRKPIALPTPRIASADPELKEIVREARQKINEVYRSAAIDTELALLMARQLEEEEEEAILLLM